ncbi:MAG TPA: TetR/AcrR family transcriptional regulator [Tepidisphaeraceae bacterium]|jgi:AcrR family transcriptional regulator|nr:TetR/AcrR family transcriptional regulator [Tepidisphaeraceae bacterium]
MKAKKASPAALGRPREFDADAALDAAMRVFWQKGYLGTSLSDLTEAMGINRPSLYAAFGNKESLFRKALARYSAGPAAYVSRAIDEPTARGVAERMMRGVAELGTSSCNPAGCLWVHGTLSCGDTSDPVHKELSAHRASTIATLRRRFARAVGEGDLPAGSDPGALARFVATVNFGLAVQAATGASRAELLRVVDTALDAWPAGGKAARS